MDRMYWSSKDVWIPLSIWTDVQRQCNTIAVSVFCYKLYCLFLFEQKALVPVCLHASKQRYITLFQSLHETSGWGETTWAAVTEKACVQSSTGPSRGSRVMYLVLFHFSDQDVFWWFPVSSENVLNWAEARKGASHYSTVHIMPTEQLLWNGWIVFYWLNGQFGLVVTSKHGSLG